MNLTVGKVYAVFSEAGATATLRNGAVLEFPAGQPVTLVAQQATLELDGDAVVREIPNGSAVLLGEMQAKAQAWVQDLRAELAALLDGAQFEVYWQASQNKLVVHTDRVADDLLEQVRSTAEAYLPAGVELVQYNHNMEISWRDINKYATCTNKNEVKQINPDYLFDTTSDGEWVYPLTGIINGHEMFYNGNWPATKTSITKFRNPMCFPEATQLSSFFEDLHFAEPITLEVIAPNCTDFRWFIADIHNLKKLKLYAPKASMFSQFAQTCQELEEVECDFVAANNMSEAFVSCKINKKSVLRICNTIPSYTSGVHRLTLGIHVDHKNDEEVLAAIANAEAKGWTVTVQWNGTATAAASVMSFGQLIYAKVGEGRDGERVLDWGHYVTDPTGYETFRSLESAYEYFGLPMPEET